MRWAAAISVVLAIVFFALLGEAVFINYFPTLAEQDLTLPAAPPPPRLPATNTPVPIPADVTQPPPYLAAGRRCGRGAACAPVSHISGAEARQAIRRGWSKHCPHCGKGKLFIGWNKPHRHCPVCGYLYERDYGDVWWVWIVTDRIPIGIGIVLLYFGFRVRSFWMGVLFFGVSLAAAAADDLPADTGSQSPSRT